MSTHAKRIHRRPRVLGAAVTGVALLLGGAFAAQAVADSGPKPAAPKVATSGDSAAAVSKSGGSAAAVSKSGGSAASDGAAKVAGAGKQAAADKAAAAPDTAPKVIKPGSGAAGK
ncbi:hypothetical protein [Streptomyces sp. NBC_00212]|uniref:hypothetical protein n=1 Tax=Streptomyces sp. NBC_00212 TaxID=2975684 RepID=UPI003251E41B